MLDNIPVFPLETPAIRPLELMPVRAEQQTLILVRDPMGLIEGMAALSPDPLLLLFLEMADGKTTLGEMAQKATMMTGQIIPAGMFEHLVQQLDEALLLQSERFLDALRAKYEEFANSPTRPCKVFAAPQGDRLKMLKELGDEMRRHRMSSISPPQNMDLPDKAVCAILSPHIDYDRGGEAYAWAYRALREHGTGARRFIILGTSHRPASNRFVATRKDFETPFGLLENDKELLDEFATAFGGTLYDDEYLHADEHTIELQAIYLKHIFGDEPIKIVPILVTSFDDLLGDGMNPTEDADVKSFCNALRTILDKYGDDVALIGAVDLSHCGPAFGQPVPNDAEREKEIAEGDKAALAAIEKGDPQAFFEHFRPDMNEQNVCSIAPIYCVMEAMRGRARAKQLTYQQSNSSDKATLVSFASFAFLKNGVSDAPRSRIILAKR